MAYTPIQRTLPQYVDTNGDPYSGAVLKAYTAGTSTNISFATDSTGGTTIATVALNANGYPQNAGTQIIPHLNENYKLALYPTQAAADSNSESIWTIDNIILATADFSDNEVTNVGNGTARDSAINVGQVQDSQFISLGTTAGAADAYTLTPSVPITSYTSTQFFIVQIHATNLTTTPYLQISGIADPATNGVIKKLDATRAEIAVEASDMLINGLYMFKRNSTDTNWILWNPELPYINTANISTANINTTTITDSGELTISSGAVTITGSSHSIDTESDASSDDLNTINGGVTGKLLIITTANDARDVIVKDGSGNIVTNTGDIKLKDTNTKLVFQYDGSNWILINNDTIKPTFSAYLSANQAITATTITRVNCNTESWDSDSWYDNATNYRYTPLRAGYYLFTGQIGYTGVADVNLVKTLFRKNGTAINQASITGRNGVTQDIWCEGSVIISMNGSTDYVDMAGYSANTGNMIGGSDDTYFQAIYLGAS